MPAFEFATAGRIIFGAGKLTGLREQLEGRAKRLLLARGRSPVLPLLPTGNSPGTKR
ncbi:MAG: hypothetical protein ACOYYU_18300 [Chloroflexota bacterium]